MMGKHPQRCREALQCGAAPAGAALLGACTAPVTGSQKFKKCKHQ